MTPAGKVLEHILRKAKITQKTIRRNRYKPTKSMN